MSGEKRTYVSVEDRELRRLREQESQLRQAQTDLPERLEAVRQQARQEMRDRMRPLEDRQRRQEGMIQGLQSDLAGLEQETCRRMKRQHDEFMGRLGDQRGEYLNLFREQDLKFTGMIADERSAREQAVTRLQSQINAIVNDANRRHAAARTFLADLSQLVSEAETLPHQRFAPGRMADLLRHVHDARASLDAGMPEASLSTAQRAYWDLADLRTQVLMREREFALIHQAAIGQARALLEEARANRTYRLQLGQGENRDAVELEVDHWTRGALTDQETAIRNLEADLRDGQTRLSTDQVRAILVRLDELKARLPGIVEDARQTILSSQLRWNIAELAARSFEAQGFTVQDAAYEGEDERNAYVVKMRNIAQDEVVTVISPVSGRMGENEVSIHTFEANLVDEAARAQRAQEMTGFLRSQGLDAKAPVHIGEANPRYRDMAAVRTRQTAQVRRSETR